MRAIAIIIATVVSIYAGSSAAAPVEISSPRDAGSQAVRCFADGGLSVHGRHAYVAHA